MSKTSFDSEIGAAGIAATEIAVEALASQTGVSNLMAAIIILDTLAYHISASAPINVPRYLEARALALRADTEKKSVTQCFER